MATFKQIYIGVVGSAPKSPGKAFVEEMAELTCKSPATVRRWLSDGETQVTPDPLTQKILAEHFGTTPEELFPTTKQQKD